jgi:hypothetical protein
MENLMRARDIAVKIEQIYGSPITFRKVVQLHLIQNKQNLVCKTLLILMGDPVTDISY